MISCIISCMCIIVIVISSGSSSSSSLGFHSVPKPVVDAVAVFLLWVSNISSAIGVELEGFHTDRVCHHMTCIPDSGCGLTAWSVTTLIELYFIGWSNNHVNNLHSRYSLEANK